MKNKLKEFWKGFTSYPPTAYDIGQLVAENLIWWVFGAVMMGCIGVVGYLIYKL